jgi:hypothetical protein
MKSRLVSAVVVVTLCISCLQGQQSSAGKNTNATATQSEDIDPLALEVLKAATDPIRASRTYSFRALVSRDHLGTNGQIVTLFNVTDVTVQRPDKLHLSFQGKGKKVELFYNAGQSILYAPEEKLYAQISSPATIDATLDSLEKKDVFIPIRNFLQTDPYKSLTDGVVTGYVIGQVMLFDQTVHQLAFTEKDAEWQLWVVGGDQPRVRRLQVIDRSKPEYPRVTIDFLDWDLNAAPSADLFTFKKPDDAKEIEILKDIAKQ